MENSQIESTINEIRKRSGSFVPFNKDKISNAIFKALAAQSKADRELADQLADKVVKKLVREGFSVSHAPSVEDIQDVVESTLIESGYSDIAKSYILYRHERRKVREDKMKVLNTKTLDPVSKKFDLNCLRVLASRYLNRNKKNEITETPTQMFERVAVLVGIGDLLYDSVLFARDGGYKQDLEEAKSYLEKLDNFDYKFKIGEYYLNKWHFRTLVNHYLTLAKNGQMKTSFKELLTLMAAKKFDIYQDKISEYYELMVSQDFLPNSPTMMNAGGRLGQLSACFVLDMKDDMEGIMKSTSDAALIFKSGGGVGINYSDLRQEGDIVASTSGVASGPVSFMNIINTVTEVVKQGGKRRGANMGILEIWHPDVEKFVTNKTEAGILENFNVSVGIWEDFWDALVNTEDGKYMLRSSRDKSPVRETNAHQLLDLIALSAWKSAEPGLIFFDQINKYNVFAKARKMPLRATNPCGEQSLYPYESCNLGSINLANLVKRKADGSYEFDWQRYEETIRKTTKFLDNVIDVNLYPVKEIDVASKESRRIGLGVMGVADLLYKLRIPYNSKEGYDLQSKLAEALTYYSMEESVALAKSRGQFPLCSKTEYPEGKIPIAGFYEKNSEVHSYEWDALIEKIKIHGIRNVLTTTVAPTGTLSMIADCSNGMEPTFALVFEKRVTVGRFFYTNKIFEQVLKDNGLYTDEILAKIADNYGSVRGIPEIPEWIQNIFVTAMDIHWSDHLMAQAVWQHWIGNAIAKTINMPYDVTAEDVKAAYLLAHEMGLKGITVYRDGSRHTQVLHMTSENAQKIFDVTPSKDVTEFVEDISNKYIKSEVQNALKLKEPEEEIPEEPAISEQVLNERLCPTCKNNLVFVEGCSICIDCGYSGCTSG
ncbi:MAG: adenosylcobalamin-dependent ribonucleoside-diphosphate reductase [Nitrosopumilaceae archaeon]|nr:adenosylcobalamin-dependent ribonucleoside-diphosphate reductase [Nitrosopumilaceae archaeon]NIT99915.1 adenosylcobalamin-dependent ribonucleoside-diphosphate reductase [Nitrosopumilaceae archaeon]NIU86268.1 adenosylcobalamin-dependent ribonucleoside-diphosphate reductase [Nitrosopumilaceae archaeon]NIV65023.1 adenosylcobalamin-dependent ribonucleoside-diphosphate reductase [Nitrosopumilaceae archaeon]NIX60518.1 adenosylcobalamin-dependent ribonucleoside-diphosphate reductase [Nitrosopumilac